MIIEVAVMRQDHRVKQLKPRKVSQSDLPTSLWQIIIDFHWREVLYNGKLTEARKD